MSRQELKVCFTSVEMVSEEAEKVRDFKLVCKMCPLTASIKVFLRFYKTGVFEV